MLGNAGWADRVVYYACISLLSYALHSAGAKKGPRKQRFPGGLRNSLLSGSDWTVSGCASLRAVPASRRQCPPGPFASVRWEPRVARRDKLPGKLAPDADSAACWLKCVIRAHWPRDSVPRVSDGGRIGHRKKPVKVDFLPGKPLISVARARAKKNAAKRSAANSSADCRRLPFLRYTAAIAPARPSHP